MMKKSICILLILCVSLLSTAQERFAHSSQWMVAYPVGGAQVPFAFDGTGPQYHVEWGMDVAWNDAWNVQRGVNFIGADLLTTARVSFQPTYAIGDDLILSDAQISAIKSRINSIKVSKPNGAMLNLDIPGELYEEYRKNYKGKPYEYYKVIKASVLKYKELGLDIISIAPFNEPDYTYNEVGTKAEFRKILEYLSADPDLAGIRLCGGNTLNDDGASEWYNYLKPYVNEGNTHQLAGNFDNYAAFFQEVRNDGNHATADELHNTMEAFVAAHYGLQTGIWWGFDGVARGDYCKASNGGWELGYGENRNDWAAGCVYRLPDNRVEAFVGVSERQANKNRIDIIATDRDVYYDGFGPVRLFQQYLPGDGVYGSDNQKNADKVIHIYSGADVPTDTIGGMYIIMNKKTRKLLSVTGTGSNSIVQQYGKKNKPLERWKITPTSFTKGGDFSYYYLNNGADEKLYMNLLNGSFEVGGSFIIYNAGGTLNEQYVFEYAGDNYYYIRCHHSGLYVETNGTTTIRQNVFTGTDSQKWRLMPVDAMCELNAPADPTGLKARGQAASVVLSWTANSDSDFSSYMVLRGCQKGGEEDWTVIGHHLTEPFFIDNSCEQGVTYRYKVVAVDKSGNRSAGGNVVEATTNGQKSLIAYYEFEGNNEDFTANMMDAATPNDFTYSTLLKKSGEKSVNLNGKTDYLLLPYQVGNMPEMTIATWMNCTASTTSWQRVFDFGNNTDQYMFFTPNNGKEARLVLKNGGAEQILSATKIGTGWKHLAITLGKEDVKIYVNGEMVASSKDINIRPSDFKPALCFLGRSQFKADPLYKGYLDDFRIYNYALSAEEIMDLKNGNATGIDMTSTVDGQTVVATDYYDLNGRRVTEDNSCGLIIVKERRSDGSVVVRKVVKP